MKVLLMVMVTAVALGLVLVGCEKQGEQAGPTVPAVKSDAVEDAGAVAAAQTVCPVMGGKVNKDIFVDHEGRRVYFCCQGCVGAFKKDAEKYLKAMADKGVKLEAAP